MKNGWIKKDDLPRLLDEALKARRVLAPVEGKDGNVGFADYRPGAAVRLDAESVLSPTKEYFFPRSEVLCLFSPDGTVREPVHEDAPVLLFGVRPCDARAVSLLDLLFRDAGPFRDPYYERRRRKALIVSVGCVEPREGCFCTAVGGGPFSREGSDVLAYPVGNAIVFESVTRAGEDFLDSSPDLVMPLTAEVKKTRDDLVRRAEEMISARPLEDIPEHLRKMFESGVWEAVSEICLGCGVCTFVCPTCHCFDITDEEDAAGGGRRVRTWDSCQYPLFTLHASGHNPRPSKKERMRQRIMHKFYYTVANTGRIFCVGCGRCVRCCPVNLDVREQLDMLSKAEVET